MDGRQGMLKINALSSLEEMYPAILLKNTRFEVVNIMAIQKIFMKGEKWYLDMLGAGVREISKEQRGKLVEHYQILTQGLQETKELLDNKSRNRYSEEEEISSSDVNGSSYSKA